MTDTAKPYRVLWSEVLLVAINDALREPRRLPPVFSDYSLAREGALSAAEIRRAWSAVKLGWKRDVRDIKACRAYFGSADFREICNLAGLDPDAVRERIVKQIRMKPLGALIRASGRADVKHAEAPA